MITKIKVACSEQTMTKIVKSRFVFAVIAFFLCFMACHVSNIEATNTQITKVNGKTYGLETIQYNGVWYVPIDAIAEVQDVKGKTGKNSYSVTLSDGIKVRIYFNRTVAKIGIKRVALVENDGKNANKKPLVKNKTVYVPLTFAEKYLNVNIVQESYSVDITKKDRITENNNAVEVQILNLVNQERKKVGLSALKLNTKAIDAANIRAKEIVSSFSHTRPNGSGFSTALDRVGAVYRGCGENIASGYASAKSVMEAWMNSSEHKANILYANHKELGIGCYEDSAGKKYWVQLFLF